MCQCRRRRTRTYTKLFCGGGRTRRGKTRTRTRRGEERGPHSAINPHRFLLLLLRRRRRSPIRRATRLRPLRHPPLLSPRSSLLRSLSSSLLTKIGARMRVADKETEREPTSIPPPLPLPHLCRRRRRVDLRGRCDLRRTTLRGYLCARIMLAENVGRDTRLLAIRRRCRLAWLYLAPDSC